MNPSVVPIVLGRRSTGPSVPTDGPLVDPFGRVHDDLRISAHRPLQSTLCVLHARGGRAVLPEPTSCERDEIVRVASVARDLGVTAVRLTGGEPSAAATSWTVRALSSLGLTT